MNVSQYVDHYVKGFVSLHNTFEDVMFHGKGVNGGMEDAKRDNITEYVLHGPFLLFPSFHLGKLTRRT